VIALPETTFPRTVRVRQHFPNPTVDDVRAVVMDELARLNLGDRVRPGKTVALTGGSRGVRNIDVIMRATVDYLKSIDARPFIIPAMGSHGGATAEGQTEVLRHYGISEETMGCAVQSGMDVVQIGELDSGVPVYLDQHAHDADYIGVINRVKPHTDFRGVVESGLCKMMAIGLGKQYGASFYHKACMHYGFESTILGAARNMIASGRVAFGLAAVENAYDETARIVATLPEELIATEQKLLEQAREWMGRMPFERLDLLIIDWMGKNISGSGMDANVIGRMYQDFQEEPSSPSILRVFVRNLTTESDGNASGIGLADITTTRLVESMDRDVTYMNAFTSNTPQKMRTPIHFDTDREALAWILNTLGLTTPEQSRTVRIRSTLHVEEVLISEALVPEARERTDLELLGEPFEMVFDDDGNLTEF